MTKVLDHGEVLLVDWMANDFKVVDAARISTGSGVPGGPKPWSEKDDRLINYLMAHGHGTPFEHAVFQFYVKCPIFVAREWQRHRIASYNEFSMRYAEVTEETAEFYSPSHIRTQDPKNRQGAVVVPENGAKWAAMTLGVEHTSKLAYNLYKQMVEGGVAREMARIVLPVNVYTKFWFTINARSLMNFLMLRNSEAALWEIREYALVLEDDFERLMPATHMAFVANGRRAP